MKKTTETYEYDKEGRLIKKTVITEEYSDRDHTYYPWYPYTQPVTSEPYTYPTITYCTTEQAGECSSTNTVIIKY